MGLGHQDATVFHFGRFGVADELNLSNVNGEEDDSVLVSDVQLLDRTDRAAKIRSGVGAKKQQNRTTVVGRQTDRLAGPHVDQLKIRSTLADVRAAIGRGRHGPRHAGERPIQYGALPIASVSANCDDQRANRRADERQPCPEDDRSPTPSNGARQKIAHHSSFPCGRANAISGTAGKASQRTRDFADRASISSRR